MNFDPNIHAELVYDGGDRVHVPERLGKPTASQLQGTPLEQLAELCGRVCYDSLGSEKSRDSAAYHRHIQEVGHLSVYEHCNVTILTSYDGGSIASAIALSALMNRPGVWLNVRGSQLRVTLNFRALLEFAEFSNGLPESLSNGANWLKMNLRAAACREMPAAFGDVIDTYTEYTTTYSLVEPECQEEQWISLLMCGSRGMSHELVRHGDFTAISQRSTRYVNEDESPWVEHPLVTVYGDGTDDVALPCGTTPIGTHSLEWETAEAFCKRIYSEAVDGLQPWLVGRGVDKFTARKQARGAARGYLGNALYTELIFSASVAQWRRMLKQRCSDAADAEIRVLFSKALGELKRSRYRDSFQDMTLRSATDGIGEVLA